MIDVPGESAMSPEILDAPASVMVEEAMRAADPAVPRSTGAVGVAPDDVLPPKQTKVGATRATNAVSRKGRVRDEKMRLRRIGEALIDLLLP